MEIVIIVFDLNMIPQLFFITSTVISLQVYLNPATGVPPISLKASCMALNSSDLLYIFGGHEKSDKTHNEIYIFNLSQSMWTESIPISPSIPVARYSSGCFISKEKFYTFGGTTNFGPLQDLWAYEAEKLKWEEIKSNEAPSFRYLFSFCKFEINGKDYFAIYGGWKDVGISSGFYMYFKFRLDIEEFKWQKLKNGPAALASASMIFYNNSILVIGGVNQSNELNELALSYNFLTEEWEIFSCFNWKSRTHFGLSIHLNQIFAFPGWSDSSEDY